MKLKYYLRGLGLGIIFTTIILMISFWSHKNDISDEEVIRRAERLGMVMKDGNSSIWNKQPDDTAATENSPTTEAVDGSDAAQQTDKGSKKNGSWRQFDTQDGEAPTDGAADSSGSEKTDKTDKADSEKTDKADTSSSEKTDDTASKTSKSSKKVSITIAKGDGCRVVAEELMAKGLVEDSEDFRKYMDKMDLDSKLKVGKFSIKKGATYEQIAKIIAN